MNRGRLVFVHGIGGQRDSDKESRLWTHALGEGAERSGHSRLAADLREGAIDVSFANYRDLFDTPNAQGDVPDLYELEWLILRDLLIEIIDTHLTAVTDDQARRALEHARIQLITTDQAQGPGSILRMIANAATTLLGIRPLRSAGQWLTGTLMVADLAQVARYLARGESDDDGATLDQRIRSRVRAALAGASVVVAHSLGTVVTFETLQEHDASLPLLVTLGSPIGMRTVVWPRLIPQPPRTPESVRTWLNYWDRDDVVVARGKIEADLRPNRSGVVPVSRRLDSDGLVVHAATKYLRQPGVAGPIAEALRADGRRT